MKPEYHPLRASSAILLLGLGLAAGAQAPDDDPSDIEREIAARIAGGETMPERLDDPGYPVAVCLGTDGNPSFQVSGHAYVCENTRLGRAIIRWRSWYCREDRHCVLSAWGGGRPTRGEILDETIVVDLGRLVGPDGRSGSASYEFRPPKWPDVAEYDARAFVLAARWGDVSELIPFIEAGQDPNTTVGFGDTALYGAARAGKLDSVRYLADHGADPNQVAFDLTGIAGAHNFTPLFGAAYEGHGDTVRFLLENGARLDGGDLTPLWAATRQGHTEVVSLILDATPSPPVGDPDFAAGLPLAAEGGHLAIVEMLLDAGVPVDSTNEKAATALIVASQNGHLDVVEALLTRQPNLGHAGNAGSPALHTAAENDHAAIVGALLSAGADIDALDKDGTTALIRAAYFGQANAVAALLEAGADTTVKWKRNNAEKWAKKRRYREIANHIRQYGRSR